MAGKGSKMTSDEYYTKKAAGICVRNACVESADGNTALCARHREIKNAWFREWLKDPRHRGKQRNRQRQLRRERIKCGLCGECGLEPLVTQSMGLKCRRRNQARGRKRMAKLAPGKRTRHCSMCGEAGHMAPACENRAALIPRAHVAAYATARIAWEP